MEALKRIDKYNRIIKNLMEDDRNGSWDELLEDCGRDLQYSIEYMIASLKHLVNEYNHINDCDIADFYKIQLINALMIKEDNTND